MTLKNTRLARAEDLPIELREQYHLPNTGLVIIETHNEDLHETFVSAENGIRAYLLKLGAFTEETIPE